MIALRTTRFFAQKFLYFEIGFVLISSLRFSCCWPIIYQFTKVYLQARFYKLHSLMLSAFILLAVFHWSIYGILADYQIKLQWVPHLRQLLSLKTGGNHLLAYSFGFAIFFPSPSYCRLHLLTLCLRWFQWPTLMMPRSILSPRTKIWSRTRNLTFHQEILM